MTIIRHSGARAISACTRVFDALWRANPESITTTGSMDSGSGLRPSRNDKSRREFIAGLGGAAALSVPWPSGARAQQRDQMRRIGVLMNQSKDDPESKVRAAAFLEALQQRGWTDGRNVRIDFRWDAGTVDNARKMAVELVALSPDVILASGVTSLMALQAN